MQHPLPGTLSEIRRSPVRQTRWSALRTAIRMHFRSCTPSTSGGSIPCASACLATFLKRDFGSRDPQLSGSVDRVALERAVATLPPGYRLVFVLHDVEGYEHNEIAGMLECSTGNSKSQLHKARLKLREILRQNEQTPVLQESN